MDSLTASWVGYVSVAAFILAYALVIFEEKLHLRKSKPVILIGCLMWALVAGYEATVGGGHAEEHVKHMIGEIAELFFFVPVAMTYINTLLERMVFDSLKSWLLRKGYGVRQLFWITHNDMNPGNLLIDSDRPERISGLIDFGDLTKSPLFIDLAVAAAYQLSPGDDPLAGVLPMISGYHGIEPLQPVEMEILTDLIRTRLITSLLIGSYRAKLFPENREYLLISHQSARNFLQNLSHLSADAALDRIRAACLKPPVETP